MKKIIKLVVMLLILGGLVAGYVIIMGKNTEQPITDPNIDEDTDIEVINLGNKVISSIEYSYKEENVSLKYSDGVWKLADDEDFPINSTYPNYMKDALMNVLARRIVSETLENESDYGMGNPTMVVKCSTENEQDYVYTMGSYNSVVDGYYFKISTQDKIYLIDKSMIQTFSYAKLDMIKTDKLPTVSAEDITEVECVVDDKKYVVTTDKTNTDFYSDIYTYFTYDLAGNKIAADSKNGAALMNAVSSAVLGNVKGYKLDKATLEKYGLADNKYAVIKVNYNNKVTTDNEQTSASVTKKESYSFYIGKYVAEDSKVSYYAMLDNSYILYELKEGEALFNALFADLEAKLVCPFTSNDIESIKIEIGENVYSYTLSDVKNNEKAKEIFNSITSLVRAGETNSQKGEVLAKVIFNTGKAEMTLTLYKYDEQNCIASFDKWDNILVSAEKVNTIINKTEA